MHSSLTVKSHSRWESYERRCRRRQKYVCQSESTALHMQQPHLYCCTCIYTCNNSVRRTRQPVESMTTCQSWNGNLAAKRGTSQLRPRIISVVVDPLRSTCIYLRRDDNRKSPLDRRGFISWKTLYPALLPDCYFAYTGKSIISTIETIRFISA